MIGFDIVNKEIMIDRINKNSMNTSPKPLSNQPQFKGAIDGAVISALQYCESQPMLNVTVLDLLTAIGPRTIAEGQTNVFSGFEAFRRESSGLIVNCLIPSFIVLGFAKLLEKPVMGMKGLMSGCWANEDSLNKLSQYYNKAKGTTPKEKIADAFKLMFSELEGIDGDVEKDGLKKFKDLGLDEYAQKLADAICDSPDAKTARKKVGGIYGEIVKKTHISEKIRFTGEEDFFSRGLDSLVVEGSKMYREFHENGITLPHAVEEFAKKASKLVTRKSLLGLGVIIPLAISMQPINRWWTSKVAGKKGAPIYKDFKDSKERELTPEQKSALFKQKLISIGSMIAVAGASIMKWPNLAMFKNVTQFSGLFPTMDQARIVSTATFSSRMGSSEDINELKEATTRDIATFFTFYFIGDYVAKAIATMIQKHSKGKIQLVNNLKPLDKDANLLQKFKHWAVSTSLKSSGEVLTKDAERARSLCQLGNILFSLVLLGIVIPKVYRSHTDRAREKELKEQGIDSKKYYPGFTMNSDRDLAFKQRLDEKVQQAV